jgi:segregation and condensation protein A
MTPTEGTPVPEPAEAWQVRLGTFEGPLDLLLHLVRINEFDVSDLPIVEITRQYQEYLDVLRELNLEIAGEYLVMAATLVHIKSRILLPPDPAVPGEEAASDPRTELARQLVEYQRYKQAAENLHAIDSVRSLIWTRDGRIPDEFAGEELLAVELFDIVAAFKKLLHRLGDEERLLLKQDDISVADKIGWLSDLIEERGSIDLVELIGGLETRVERIAVFLAVLEMIRLQMIVAFQRAVLSEIRLARRSDVAPAPEEA